MVMLVDHRFGLRLSQQAAHAPKEFANELFDV